MYCNKCGKEIHEGDRFCSECGAPLAGQTAEYGQNLNQNQPNYNQSNYNQPNYSQPQQPYKAKSDNSKLFSVLAYISPLWLIGMLATPEKNNGFVRFHVGQGIVLTIFSVAVSIITRILTSIASVISNIAYASTVLAVPLYIIIGMLAFGLGIAGFTFIVMGIINAYNGEMKPLPFIGQFAFYK